MARISMTTKMSSASYAFPSFSRHAGLAPIRVCLGGGSIVTEGEDTLSVNFDGEIVPNYPGIR